MSFIQELVRSGGMKLEAKDNKVVEYCIADWFRTPEKPISVT